MKQKPKNVTVFKRRHLWFLVISHFAQVKISSYTLLIYFYCGKTKFNTGYTLSLNTHSKSHTYTSEIRGM